MTSVVSHVNSVVSHVTSADESLVWLSVTAPLKNIVTQNEDVFEQTYTYLLTRLVVHNTELFITSRVSRY